jgi:hypothetical protein
MDCMRPAFDDGQLQRASRSYCLDLHGPLRKEEKFHNIRSAYFTLCRLKAKMPALSKSWNVSLLRLGREVWRLRI